MVPFLNEGLKSLGRYLHGELCIVSIGVFGISGMTLFLPVAQIPRTSVFGFIFLYALITYYKWYSEPFSSKKIGLILLEDGQLLLVFGYWYRLGK